MGIRDDPVTSYAVHIITDALAEIRDERDPLCDLYPANGLPLANRGIGTTTTTLRV